MSLGKQIVEAIRCQIEDFFNVPWQGVVSMLIFIAGILDLAYLRNAHPIGYLPPFWSVHTLLAVACLLVILYTRRISK